VKRLIFCFDGTWNRLDAEHSTNVVITAESVVPIASDGTTQMIFYDQGVGTGKLDRWTGGIFGFGLVTKLADAYRFLIFNYSPGDEIYVFGFSRGAFTARSFVGMLSYCGILARRSAGKATEAIELYRARKDTAAYAQTAMCFRRDYSPEICVSDAEAQWRLENVPDYLPTSAPHLKVAYLGVWDTVGALGVPATFTLLNPLNLRYRFHDTNLTATVQSARHAVAIDEHRRDFQPTLWKNLKELNEQAKHSVDADDAPYQQRWFPGVHGAVGGGGSGRGLSDQALDWVLDGARRVGLELDKEPKSRIFELAPNYRDFLNNSDDPGLFFKLMNFIFPVDRGPGPTRLFETSISARRRWREQSENLADLVSYRPPSLSAIAKDLDDLDPSILGLGLAKEPKESFRLYTVKKGDSLRAIARAEYGDANMSTRIFAANLDKLEDENRIYVGNLLRIPIAANPTTSGLGLTTPGSKA
jgi:uncharacterized protein (DUF2235 family)